MMPIHPDATFVRNPRVLHQVVDDETVMMNIEKGLYYGLDSIGTRIWELLAQPVTWPSLCDQLLQEFDVTPQQCENDVAELLDRLLVEGIVVEFAEE